MDIKLESFIAVVELQSYTAAAKQLNLTQPGVSQHIKQLEANYGTTLLVKNRSKIILTDEGEIVYKYAKKIQSIYRELDKRVAYSRRYSKNLTVGITHTAEGNIAPEVLAEYSSKKNGAHISIVSDSSKKLYDKLNEYIIDLAIIEGQVSSKVFSKILLGTDSLMVVMSPDNPLSKQKSLSIESLKKEKLVLRTFESDTTNLFVNELEKTGLSIHDFDIYLELDSIASIKDLLKKNLGVSVLPNSDCAREIKEGTLIALPIDGLHLVRETFLVYLENNIDKETLNEIASIYKEKLMSI